MLPSLSSTVCVLYSVHHATSILFLQVQAVRQNKPISSFNMLNPSFSINSQANSLKTATRNDNTASKFDQLYVTECKVGMKRRRKPHGWMSCKKNAIKVKKAIEVNIKPQIHASTYGPQLQSC